MDTGSPAKKRVHQGIRGKEKREANVRCHSGSSLRARDSPAPHRNFLKNQENAEIPPERYGHNKTLVSGPKVVILDGSG
jgi:hypothetical protein